MIGNVIKLLALAILLTSPDAVFGEVLRSREASSQDENYNAPRKLKGDKGSAPERGILPPNIKPKPFRNCIPQPPGPKSKGDMSKSKSKGKGKGQDTQRERPTRSERLNTNRRNPRERILRDRMRMRNGNQNNNDNGNRGKGKGKGNGNQGNTRAPRGMMNTQTTVNLLPYCPAGVGQPAVPSATSLPTSTPQPSSTPVPTSTPVPSFTPFPTNLLLSPGGGSPVRPTSTGGFPLGPPPTTPTAPAAPTGTAPAPTPATGSSAGGSQTIVQSTLEYGFFAGVVPTEPRADEITGVLAQTNNFYDQILTAKYPGNYISKSVNAALVGSTFTSGAELPVKINFDLSANFSGTAPSTAELLAALQAADYENYIQNFVWNSEPIGNTIFFETQKAQYSARVA